MGKIKQFILNAVNGWVTTSVGAVIGLPEIWQGIQPLLDDDPATGIIWKTVLTGVGILLAGMFTRDWTKAVVKSESHPNGGE